MKTVPQLEFADARRMADAALREAQAAGVAVSVAVCDAAGRLLVFLRDDRALGISVDLAPAKARTAALVGAPSRQLEQAVNRGYPALATLPGYALLGGAVEVRAGGHVVGGIAVSGAESGEKDEALARAGLAALEAAGEGP